MDEIEDGSKFGTSCEGGAVAGLGVDHGAVCSLKRRHLGMEVLIRGRDPSPDFSPRGLNEAALYAINVV